MNAETRMELERLLSQLCDGSLDAAQVLRLEELLAAGPANRRFYLEYLDMHARLLHHPQLTARPKPSTVPADRSRLRKGTRRVLSHAAVAVASVAAALLIALPGQPITGTGPNAAIPREQSGQYVATFTKLTGCVWERAPEPRREGYRIMPGELRLSRGVAQIHFDTGGDLILEAPCTLQIHSNTAATLISGKVVFRGDELNAAFDLRTPASKIVDFGTEYAVLVQGDREEVHVFEGEVQRLPNGFEGETAGEHLKAGVARRYSPAGDEAGQPTLLDAPHFVRHTPDAETLADGSLVYEGFDYANPSDIAEGRANGGTGWRGPWIQHFARPNGNVRTFEQILNVREGLSRPDSAVPAVGGCMDYNGFAKAFRRLEKPIRLDVDGVHYLSFLVRPNGPPRDPTNAVAVLFWTEEDGAKMTGDTRRRLNIGIGGANRVFTHIGEAGRDTPMPLNYGETYLLVAKIVTSAAKSDQVFIRIYAPREPVERVEPGCWSVVGEPFHSDLEFAWIQLHVNSALRQSIDEFRLGGSWAAVTSPWIAPLKKDS